MKDNFLKVPEYKTWLDELKEKFRRVQIQAIVKVNSTMLHFYWELGAGIVEKQKTSKWGDGVIQQLSKDLTLEFPNVKGFSERNIKYIRQWYLFYMSQNAIGQQTVAQFQLIKNQNFTDIISQIPWGHNILIISKCRHTEEAFFYAQMTIQNHWSRAVLAHQLESKLYQRKGKTINNFEATLPAPQSDLAKQMINDPYIFDFANLREKHDELELENALLSHITRFLLELGAGFSYIGRQYKLDVGGDEFYIDLLFYHVRLHCYVVVELKTTKFEPEFAGKLNFYVSAVDRILKTDRDSPTIGMLICKSKNNTVVEYSLRDIQKPIGVSEYLITKHLPDEFKSSLPSIEDIEAELNLD